MIFSSIIGWDLYSSLNFELWLNSKILNTYLDLIELDQIGTWVVLIFKSLNFFTLSADSRLYKKTVSDIYRELNQDSGFNSGLDLDWDSELHPGQAYILNYSMIMKRFRKLGGSPLLKTSLLLFFFSKKNFPSRQPLYLFAKFKHF